MLKGRREKGISSFPPDTRRVITVEELLGEESCRNADVLLKLTCDPQYTAHYEDLRRSGWMPSGH